MTWRVRIHPLVLEEDFRSIDRPAQAVILKAVRKKLTVSPKEYGSPLRGEFKAYWKLRVGDYRVVYRIVEHEILVLVVKVGIRTDGQVYQQLFPRLRKDYLLR
jgi:mRNA interferase RelE/StbE